MLEEKDNPTTQLGIYKVTYLASKKFTEMKQWNPNLRSKSLTNKIA